MTMDYFLLLCSLLLPVVSAVEGKKRSPIMFASLVYSLLGKPPPKKPSLPYIKSNISSPKMPSVSPSFCPEIIDGIIGFAQTPVPASTVRFCHARKSKAHPSQLFSCVFLFVGSAIAGCCRFLCRFSEISATLYLIGESVHPTTTTTAATFLLLFLRDTFAPPGRLRVF